MKHCLKTCQTFYPSADAITVFTGNLDRASELLKKETTGNHAHKKLWTKCKSQKIEVKVKRLCIKYKSKELYVKLAIIIEIKIESLFRGMLSFKKSNYTQLT